MKISIIFLFILSGCILGGLSALKKIARSLLASCTGNPCLLWYTHPVKTILVS